MVWGNRVKLPDSISGPFKAMTDSSIYSQHGSSGECEGV